MCVLLDVPVARKRKKEKQRQRRSMVPTLSSEELMESPTFKKFTNCMEYVFDTAEDANLAALDISKLEVGPVSHPPYQSVGPVTHPWHQ